MGLDPLSWVIRNSGAAFFSGMGLMIVPRLRVVVRVNN